MDQSFDSTNHNKDLNSFLSSYLYDLSRAVSQMRQLVLTLINVKIQPLPCYEIAEDMISIVSACRRTFNELKKTESLLRGHVKAKQSSKVEKSRCSVYSAVGQSIYSRNASNSWSETHQTPFFTMKSIKQSCDFEGTKHESAATFISRYTEQQNKSNKGQKDAPIRLNSSRNKVPLQNVDFKKRKESQSDKPKSSRVNSLQMVKRLEDLRQNGSLQLSNFENKNKECLSIIKQIKEEVKLKQSKLKKKVINK